jgi:hypothetical protein
MKNLIFLSFGFAMVFGACKPNMVCECEIISQAMENELNEVGEDIEKWEEIIERYKSSMLKCEQNFLEMNELDQKKWLQDAANCGY